jgi:hypothetical protein
MPLEGVCRNCLVQRTGLAEVRELVFRPPSTDDDLKTEDERRYSSPPIAQMRLLCVRSFY